MTADRRPCEGRRRLRAVGAVIAVLSLLSVEAPLADPLLLPWGDGSASMAAGGSHAPSPLLGEVTPEAPTSLTLTDRPRVSVELASTVPFTYVHGRRRFAELRVDRQELGVCVPLVSEGARSRWWLGGSLAETSMHLYHRDRWLDDRARGHGSGGALAIAWQNGPWTLGAARHRADLGGAATGANLARYLHTRRGRERLEFDWDGGGGSIAAEYQSGLWSAGLQVNERDGSARAATEIARSPFSGLLSAECHEFDAWVARGVQEERWFAYLRCTALDTGKSALASGDAIRGRVELATDGIAVGAGRRRERPRQTEHLELSWIEQSLDLNGRVATGALGSLDGQISLEGSARARILGARWGRAQTAGDWRYTLAASVLHADLDLYARGASSPGPFQAPDWRFEQRLAGGEAWLGSLTLGGGREVDGWRVTALYTVFAGDASGEYEDLLEPQAALPPDPPTGPSPTLDLGWAFSLRVSRDL